MGKSSPTPPAAPDPGAIASAQQALNLETAVAQAYMGAGGSQGPFGQVDFTEVDSREIGGEDVPQYRSVTTLSPDEQAKLDLTNNVNLAALTLGGFQLEDVARATEDPFDFEGIIGAPGGDDFSDDRQRVEDAILARLQPQFDRDKERLENQLVNQGFTRGSEGYTRGLDEHNRALTDARLQTTLAGGAEQSRLFGLQSSARERAIQERLLERSQPINELGALLGFSSGVQMPQFSPTPQAQIAPTDAFAPAQLNYAAQQNAFNQAVGTDNSLRGGLFGLGGSVLGGAAMTLPWPWT